MKFLAYALSILILSFFSISAYSQSVFIKGCIKDDKNNPLSFANIFIEGTIDGTSSEEDGSFILEASSIEKIVLKVNLLGYQEQKLLIDSYPVEFLNITLKEDSKVLNEVTVSASNFIIKGNTDISEKLAVDLVTVAGSEGDIYKSISMLPGTQASGSDGKLLVRGGDSRESQTYIDDMHVLNAYTSVPENVGARSRYSPFLFDGISFSMGGYSSEYSQGLSSILPLTTKDEVNKSKLGVSLMSTGVGASGTQMWSRSSASFNFDFTNIGPYNNLFYPKDKKEWPKAYKVFSGQNQLRFQINDKTHLKTYFAYDKTRFERVTKDDFKDDKRNLDFDEDNLYLNTTLRTSTHSGVNVFTGIAYSMNDRNINGGLIAEDKVRMKESELHLKMKGDKRFSNIYKLGLGVESLIKSYDFSYRDSIVFNKSINHSVEGLYLSNDFLLNSNLYLNVSGRVEYTSSNKEWKLLPRVALNYELNKFVFTGAYGKYQQLPLRDYLLYNNRLNTENCRHFVFGVHHQSENKTYRIEMYHKKYDDLTTISDGSYGSMGKGFSNGIDVFFNDRKFLGKWQYMLSYSYNNSKRKFGDYMEMITPQYATKHNAAISLKYDFMKLKSIIGITNRFASGRPYNNPNKDGVMNSTTPVYNSLDFCITLLAHKRLIIHALASNVLGRNNIYGYNYSSVKNDAGKFDRAAIQSYHNRFFMVGFFFTLSGGKAYDASKF